MWNRRLTAAALSVVAASLAVGLGGGAAGADAGAFAPLDRPGPALSVPATNLAAAVHCSGSFTANSLEPVLLNPGTGVTAEENYSWNYEPAFNAQHRPWCAVTMPYDTLGDIQTAGEYLVFAIRSEYALAHRRIAILGHSQGGMSMRWALRFWPDTRAMVDDVIGLAGTNHGTTVRSACVPNQLKCPPASWQQAAGANFITALNSGAETFAGISYTEIYSHTDEVVEPNSSPIHSTSSLHTGDGQITNVATQSICPLDIDEHLLIGTIDPVAYAVAMDALNHSGPADPARISRNVCLQLVQPGVNPLSLRTYLEPLLAAPGLLAVGFPAVNVVGAPEVANEPPLRCYVYAAGC